MTVPTYRLWSDQRAPWGDRTVVTGNDYWPAISALLPTDWNRDGERVFLDLALQLDPTRQPGTCAISVAVAGHTIGYLPDDQAPRWEPTIRRLLASGVTPIANGRIEVREYPGWLKHRYVDQGNGLVEVAEQVPPTRQIHAFINLPDDPALAIPLNDPPPDPFVMLPRSRIVQVTKEDEHFDTLFDYVPPSGHGHLYATLRRESAAGARTSRSIVAVLLDGRKVGQLTPQMSKHFAPIIEHFADRGMTTACWADITGSSLAAEVRIDAAKAHEVDDSVLSAPPANVPRLVRPQ